MLLSLSLSPRPITVHFFASTTTTTTTKFLISEELLSPTPTPQPQPQPDPHLHLNLPLQPLLLHPRKRRQSSCLHTPFHRGRLKKKKKKKKKGREKSRENALIENSIPIFTPTQLYQASQLRSHRPFKSLNLPINHL